MSGLFSQAILDMLAAEGTTPATKSLILDFLNAAQSVNDIAGIEPQEGPVVDDPARGFGDQVADYDIGAVVAQRIIDTYVRRLRRKFEVIDPAFDAIETVIGAGYTWKSRG